MRCAALLRATVAATLSIGLTCGEALAYTGPGAGLTAIGAFLALVAGLLLAIVGFLWYPLKKLLRRMRARRLRRDEGLE
ncbi:MAG: hypothetical protein R6X25_00645 [Candidatus Krumholzibacteriia bacterium]